MNMYLAYSIIYSCCCLHLLPFIRFYMCFLRLFPKRHDWNIIPDFTAEEFYAEADFTVHGRIFGVQILALALRIILDKNCRRLYNRFKHMK